MAKIFTPTHILFTATKRKRTIKTTAQINELSLEPGDASVEFLLNYSKSLEILHSKSIGCIDNIGN